MEIALFTQEGILHLLRWVHFLAGVVWIGHLYYLNFVQGAFMPEVDATVKNNVLAKLLPKAMWWFRWGAMFTFLSGVAMLAIAGHELKADFFNTSFGIFIYAGALLGTIMFLNVWLVIWPKQKIVIANAENVLKGNAANPEAAKVAPQALLASRTNVMFSIPMLFLMGAARHLNLAIPEGFSPIAVLAAVTAVVAALEVNALFGKLGPLATVKGVIHIGLGLAVALYAIIEVLV